MTKGKSFFAEEAVGGLSAGVVGTVIGFPLDTIKTRMQTASGGHTITSMARSIVQKEGIFALYRGLVPPLLSLSALNTINFTSYSYFRQNVFEASNGWDIRNGLSGILIGPLASAISTVENVIKTQMQVDNVRSKQFQGSLHCMRTLVQLHGPQIIYTGHMVNTTREGVFLGTYFFVYEGFREMLFRTANSNTDNHQGSTNTTTTHKVNPSKLNTGRDPCKL
ncbi:Mitochondrial basic amino acids transporter [Seminavis robusta]|uniref:Mitochondrial basic amino acids transporter n=1 Tax=Seminavis robusta TaxID=568900 RepID=A0A9N8E094_9STRA|nr:Mitochondrial basic amino acids transporter [Seminavis robusta]|eukprot:Sro421_g139490.1 Mitochondrial basic amino acids transporter (222) ;mRNA; r:18819-19739